MSIITYPKVSGGGGVVESPFSFSQGARIPITLSNANLGVSLTASASGTHYIFDAEGIRYQFTSLLPDVNENPDLFILFITLEDDFGNPTGRPDFDGFEMVLSQGPNTSDRMILDSSDFAPIGGGFVQLTVNLSGNVDWQNGAARLTFLPPKGRLFYREVYTKNDIDTSDPDELKDTGFDFENYDDIIVLVYGAEANSPDRSAKNRYEFHVADLLARNALVDDDDPKTDDHFAHTFSFAFVRNQGGARGTIWFARDADNHLLVTHNQGNLDTIGILVHGIINNQKVILP